MMILFRKITAILVATFFMACATYAADKTDTECLNGANVFFDVQRNGNALDLIAKESGIEKFRTKVADSNFGSFKGYSQNNFNLEKLAEGLKWQYQSATGEFFEMIVKQNGDISFLDSAQTNTGHDKYKTYGFKTSGTLENKGSQAFYYLIASANQIHNYGTIQSMSGHTFQNYKFNSGVWKYGKIPTGIADLRKSTSNARPSFKSYVIENYGEYISENGMQIKSGLSYHEYSSGNFENLEMFGGDINVQDSSILNINGNLNGNVRNMNLSNNSSLLGNKINVGTVQNLSVGNNSIIHTKESLTLTVNASYNLSGTISTDDSLTLTATQATATQPGTLYAPNGVYAPSAGPSATEIANLRQQAINEAKLHKQYFLTESAQLIAQIELGKKQMEEAISREADILFERRMIAQGYKNVGGSWEAPRKKRGMTFSFGIGTGGMHFSGHTTGYNSGLEIMHKSQIEAQFAPLLNQKVQLLQQSVAKMKTYEEAERNPVYNVPKTIPVVRPDRIFTGIKASQNQEIQRLKATISQQQTETLKRKQTLETIISRQKEISRQNLEFYPKILSSLKNAGISNSEISDIYGDRNTMDIIGALRNFSQREVATKLISQNPKLATPIQTLENLKRDAIADRSWWQTYFCPQTKEEAISRLQSMANNPLEDLIMKHPEFLLGPASLGFQGLQTAGAMAIQKVAPRLLALGATNHAWENFVNYMKGGKDAVKPSKQNLEPNKERLQSTRQDADRYLDGLKEKGALSDKQIAKDGREYYEVTKKFEHKGLEFKKGDYISRDTQHHEWEYFKGAENHKGAIDPISGELNIGKAKNDRTLKIK